MEFLSDGDLKKLKNLVGGDLASPVSEAQDADVQAVEALFGELAVKRGAVTRSVVEEALAEQRRLREQGEDLRIGQILLRNGALTLPQYLEVLQLQRQSVLECPQCHKIYNLSGGTGPVPMQCLRCGIPLSPPTDGDSLVQPVERITPYHLSGAPAPAMQLGKYRLLREVGRGGMGVVYEATDPDLKRKVALKILKETSNAPVKRLHREAVLAGRLQHPNIVQVHEVGMVRGEQGGGIHYISMELVEGTPLDEALKQKALTMVRILSILEQVARGVQYAHENGVIHRDIKPSNILIDRSGRPLLADFGLAKIREEGVLSQLTRTGTVMGTPLYMAPEQIRGDSEIDGRVDVYALGVVLYEATTGQVPFTGARADEIYHKVLESDVRRPRSVNRALDADLETVILKAMAREKEDRYRSAGDLAEDLGRIRGGEAIQARPSSMFHTVRRFVKRRKGISTLAGLLFLSVLLGIALLMSAQRRSERYANAMRQIQELDSETRRLRTRGGIGVTELRREISVLLQRLADLQRDFPEEPSVYLVRARMLRLLAEDEGIDRDLREALRLDPENGMIHFDLVQYCLDRVRVLSVKGGHKTPQQVSRWNDLIQEETGRWRAHLDRLTEARRGLGEEEKEIAAALDRAREDPPGTIEKATLRIEVGGFTAPWYIIRSQALGGGSGMWREAADDLREAVRQLPNDPYLRLEWIMALWQSRQLETAIRELKNLISLQPEWSLVPSLHAFVAHFLTLLGRPDQALEEIEVARKAEPENPWYCFSRGGVLVQLRRLEEAEKDLLAAVAADRSFYLAYWWLGDARFLQGKYREALEDYASCTAVSPGKIHSGADYGRAQALLALGRREEALEAVETAIEIDQELARESVHGKTNPAHFFFRGEILRSLNRPEEALASYGQAIETRSSGNPVHPELLWMFLQRYEQDPEDWSVPLKDRQSRMWARVYAARARVFETLGRADEAATDRAEAARLDPTPR